MHRLFKLEREAEQRVHEARDREIDLGGPGSARRASEAMDAPMLEVAKIRKMRQRFGDLQMAIDHNSNLLRRTKRNPDLSSDVKRHRIGQVETKLAGLTADFKVLEAEAEQEYFGGAVPPGLPVTPRSKPEPAPAADHETKPEVSPTGGNAQERFSDKWAAKGRGGPRGPYAVPTLTDKLEREDNLRADKPARFVVRKNPNADDGPVAWEFPSSGAVRVLRHDVYIKEAAKKYGVDADLIRAVMWAEAARGHKVVFNDLADSADRSSSYMPMNIQQGQWAGLIGATPSQLKNPRPNIEAGAELLRRISERIEDPTPAKIGSVWNYAGRESVSDFGAYIGRLYHDKPWRSWRLGDPSEGPTILP